MSAWWRGFLVYASAMTARGIRYLATSCPDGLSIIWAIVPRMTGARHGQPDAAAPGQAGDGALEVVAGEGQVSGLLGDVDAHDPRQQRVQFPARRSSRRWT